jgi:hypothetical protein
MLFKGAKETTSFRCHVLKILYYFHMKRHMEGAQLYDDFAIILDYIPIIHSVLYGYLKRMSK